MDARQIATQLAITQAMAEELPHYLASGALYYQMLVDTPSGTQQPVMTLGALLENIDVLRAEADGLTHEQRAQLAQIEGQVSSARRRQPDHWRDALRRELKALLNSWKWALEDAERDPDRRVSGKGDVPRRSRLDLIRRELANDPASDEEWRQLADLDARQQRLDKR
jgi:hypothetical protein